MIVVAMIIYYVLAIGLIGLVTYLTAEQSIRRSRARVDQMIAVMQQSANRFPPLEPYVPEPLPEPPPPPVLRIPITRRPEPDGVRLPKMAVAMIREASRLEESFGGDGLEYDPSGSDDEPGRLVLRLVPRSADWDATDRLTAVAEELNRLMSRAKRNAAEKDTADIRVQIERELRPHLSPEMSEYVGVATVS